MRAIQTILKADATVTDVTSQIYVMQAPQKTQPPFVVAGDSDLLDPHDTFSGQLLDEYTLTVYVWGKRMYTGDGITGANNLAGLVRTALHGVNGEYNGENVKVNFLSQSTDIFPNESTDKYLVEQEYQIFINRA